MENVCRALKYAYLKRQCRRASAIACLALLAVGPSLSSAQDAPRLPATGSRPESASRKGCNGTFAGVWQTTYGVMDIRLDGNRASSKYNNGYVIGWVTGNELEADWIETSEFGQGIGPLQFVLSPDGKKFTGGWSRTAGIGNYAGSWSGECVAANSAGAPSD